MYYKYIPYTLNYVNINYIKLCCDDAMMAIKYTSELIMLSREDERFISHGQLSTLGSTVASHPEITDHNAAL